MENQTDKKMEDEIDKFVSVVVGCYVGSRR